MKRAARRMMLVVGVVACVLLAAWVVVIFSVGRTPVPPLPQPNGYDDLLKAAQAVTGRIEDAADLNRDDLRILVATNAEALRLVRLGLSRPCMVPTDAVITNFASINADLIGLKSLGKLLSAEGRLAEIDNRPAEAARSSLAAIRLGSEMSRGGLMINRLVGIACEGIGSISLWNLFPKITCQQMRPVIAELEEIDSTTVPWREVLRNEDRFMRAQAGRYPNPIRLVSDLWQARNIRKEAQEAHNLAAAHIRLLTMELALRSYRCDHGAGPATLDRLVPAYLKRLPLDPFSGEDLRYQPAGTNWVLYSLGPDRVDDGGKPITKMSHHLIGFESSDSQKAQKGDLVPASPW